jgi:hypothetical protein
MALDNTIFTAGFLTQTGKFIRRQQSFRPHPGQHRQRIRALRVIEDACHLSVALFDDFEDIKVALMAFRRCSSMVI